MAPTSSHLSWAVLSLSKNTNKKLAELPPRLLD